MFSAKKLIKISFILIVVGFLALFSLYLSLKDQLPSVESLKEMKWQTPMQIFSADGQLISQFGEKKRIPLTLDEMPQQLINAILATEDDRFYQHFGLDPIGLSRAIIGQIIGQNKGGGSTITMQVARNFFLTREQTYIRKIKEIFISFHIEWLLSKDEILELYMNKIELGHRAFGFGAAAQVYYGKTVNELSLAQIAVLAGLPKAPSTLNPISSPERAKQRRAVVLQRMLVSGYIDATQYETANNAPITAERHGAEIELNAPYVAEMAHQEMLARYGADEAYTGGYKVFTTINAGLQRAAQHAVVSNLLSYDQRHGYRGAVGKIVPIMVLSNDVITPLSEGETNDVVHTEKQSVKFDPQVVLNTLSMYPSYQKLLPALVTDVLPQSAKITVLDENSALVDTIIPWQGLSWAREFYNDEKQGPAPETADQILTAGDIIYVLPEQDGEYRLSQLPQASAALVALSPDNGAIQSAVGGFSFKQSQYNRVTQAKRQVGSNIKPFIYSAALEQGLSLASLINDAPINQWDRSSGFVWRPKNSPPTYDGPIRVRLALAQSKNVIAVRLLREVGLDKMINHLSLFGFSPDELPHNESLALGSASLTPLEVATGFATFANGGFLIEPYLIERIEDSFGNIVYQANPAIACDNCDQINHYSSSPSQLTATIDPQTVTTGQIPAAITAPKAERVISEQNAFLITEALNSAIWGADWSVSPGWQGTGFRARSLKRRDIAGKTGTTNEAKDAWFSGYSRRIVATSWIGFDDPQRNLGQTTMNKNLGKQQITGKEFGAKSAQPAWINFMKQALTYYPEEAFHQPDNIVTVRIDKATGKLTTKTDKSSLFEYFVQGTEPTDYINRENASTVEQGARPADTEIF